MRLAAPTSFYVSPSGSDANSGLAPACAWRTIQYAWSFIRANVDCAGFTPTIQLAGGTFTESVALAGPLVGAVQVIFCGSPTPGETVWLIGGGGMCAQVRDWAGATFYNISFGGSGAACISAEQFGVADIGSGVVFGSAVSGVHLRASDNGAINIVGNYTIAGNAGAHLQVAGGRITIGGGVTVSIPGAAAFSYFAQCYRSGGRIVIANGASFSGSATGIQGITYDGGHIETNGAVLPGNQPLYAAPGGPIT